MRFSRTALHKNMFISADNTIISNVLTNDTSSSADAQLKNYKGTISDHCVGDNELIYYEVNYTYTILKALTGRNLVLEIGLAERSKVDQYHYGGNNNVSAWSFNLAKRSNIDSVYFFAQDHRFDQKISGPFSKTTVGTNIHGKFKLFINRRRNEFLMTQDDSIIHVFKNVTSTGKLCPIFGVYNPYRVHVKLQLMNPRNFTNYPW
ncbi:unnamed protein product [Mytilus edulis]|uniref:Uncharacterized protein n=1 Tax=Mytilus edulis TaxID=6550 RepID=A0A8S3U9H2_MYTED|nr:unnamed protein product [Mytilus edulis]